MRDYDLDEYEDYDDYEDGSGQEDEYEEDEVEEEEPKPTAEELKYLELRQKLKETYRKKMKNESSGSQEKKKNPDNFGSFFGPSKPVIAQRVIQESKPLLEDQQLAARVLSQYNSKKSPSAPSGSKTGERRPQPPRVSERKQKVEKIKNTRDYSFLLSDDAELPAPSKQPPPRSISTQRTEVRPGKLPLQNKQASIANGSRHMSNGGAERRPLSSNGQSSSRPGHNRQAPSSKPNTMAASNSKQLSGSGPGRPLMQNGLQSKKPVASIQRPSLPNSKSSLPSGTNPPAKKLQSSASRQTVEQRRVVAQMRETNRGEQRRDPRELFRDERRRDMPHGRRETLEPNRGDQRSEPSRNKVVSRTPVLSAKQHVQGQMKRPVVSRVSSHDQRPKKRPARPFSDEEDEGEMAISMIRNMFRYNPSKFAGRDDDDSDMEANFDDIINEENRSARIAKKEDEEQLRLIELEEKRERMRKMKKRKMG